MKPTIHCLALALFRSWGAWDFVLVVLAVVIVFMANEVHECRMSLERLEERLIPRPPPQ